MKSVITLLFSAILVLPAYCQQITHEFTKPQDSLKLEGLRVIAEMDTVYHVTDSSGFKFSLELENTSLKTVKVTNPLYEPELRIHLSLVDLQTEKMIRLMEGTPPLFDICNVEA